MNEMKKKWNQINSPYDTQLKFKKKINSIIIAKFIAVTHENNCEKKIRLVYYVQSNGIWSTFV